MNIIRANLLHVTYGIIGHQVNLRGKMGTGIALDIRTKYPLVYERYLKHYRDMKLGMVLPVTVSNDPLLIVANLAGQEGYGRDRRYTDYDAIRECLTKLREYTVQKGNLPVYLPFRMGCNNAGGEWDIVSGIIEECIPEAVICRL